MARFLAEMSYPTPPINEAFQTRLPRPWPPARASVKPAEQDSFERGYTGNERSRERSSAHGRSGSGVLDAIAELGFVRDESARASRAGRSRTVGLVVLDVANPFVTDVARGGELVLDTHGALVTLCDSA